MLKKILKVDGTQSLSKNEQKLLQGGSSRCPTPDPIVCKACGGFPLSNGCCLGDAETHACLLG